MKSIYTVLFLKFDFLLLVNYFIHLCIQVMGIYPYYFPLNPNFYEMLHLKPNSLFYRKVTCWWLDLIKYVNTTCFRTSEIQY